MFSYKVRNKLKTERNVLSIDWEIQTNKQGKMSISTKILFELRVANNIFNFFKHCLRQDKRNET